MKPHQFLPYLGMTGAIAVLVAQPVLAQVVQVTGIEVKQTENGLDLVVNTADGSKPQISTSSNRNTIIANISNAQLNLAGGSQFRSANPATGIAEVTAINLNTNTVQIRIRGTANIPKLSVAESAEPGLILSVQPQEQEIDITVTAATRTEESIANIPRSVTVIEREQIQQQVEISTSRSLPDILPKLVPGFGVPTENTILNTTTGLRGRFPQVLIDGVPIKSNVFTGQARDLTSIDPSAIERIEVVRGPTAVYGDGGTGGVVNIITRKAGEDKLTSRLEVSVDGSAGDNSFLEGDSIGNSLQYGLSGTDGKFDYNIALSRNQTGSFFDAEGDLIPSDDGNGSDSLSFGVLGKVGFNLDSNQRLEVAINHQNNNWKDWFQEYGNALGKSQEAENILNNYQQRVKDLQQKIGEKRSQTQVSIAMFLDGLRIYMKKSFCGGIVDELGLKRPPLQDLDEINKDISLELIPEMAGDVIFLITDNPGNKLKELSDRPLWSQLDAVKKGKLYQVKADIWQNGYGPAAANLILDDIANALLSK